MLNSEKNTLGHAQVRPLLFTQAINAQASDLFAMKTPNKVVESRDLIGTLEYRRSAAFSRATFEIRRTHFFTRTYRIA
jgi:hypothetical protein